MSIDDRQSRSYELAKKLALKRLPLKYKIKGLFRRRRQLTLKQKEQALRRDIRKSYRRMYVKYPQIAYLNLKQDRSDWSSALRGRHEKNIEESRARQQKNQKGIEEYLAKYPQNRKYLPAPPDPAEIEMHERVSREELERLKTLPPARRNYFEEFTTELKYLCTAIRYFYVFRIKRKLKYLKPLPH